MSQDADNQEISELLDALSAGDRAAANDLVRRLTPLVSRLVFRLTGWHPDTQDLVQDVFLNLQRSWKSFDSRSQLTTWVTSITINRCRNWHRTQSRTPSQSGIVVEELIDDARRGISLEDQENLRRALRCLSASDRELIVLRYLEEMDLDEISEMTGTKKNTIEVRLHRARHRMMEAMSPVGQENSRG